MLLYVFVIVMSVNSYALLSVMMSYRLKIKFVFYAFVFVCSVCVILLSWKIRKCMNKIGNRTCALWKINEIIFDLMSEHQTTIISVNLEIKYRSSSCKYKPKTILFVWNWLMSGTRTFRPYITGFIASKQGQVIELYRLNNLVKAWIHLF